MIPVRLWVVVLTGESNWTLKPGQCNRQEAPLITRRLSSGGWIEVHRVRGTSVQRVVMDLGVVVFEIQGGSTRDVGGCRKHGATCRRAQCCAARAQVTRGHRSVLVNHTYPYAMDLEHAGVRLNSKLRTSGIADFRCSNSLRGFPESLEV
jgi:hypothetical protein